VFYGIYVDENYEFSRPIPGADNFFAMSTYALSQVRRVIKSPGRHDGLFTLLQTIESMAYRDAMITRDAFAEGKLSNWRGTTPRILATLDEIYIHDGNEKLFSMVSNSEQKFMNQVFPIFDSNLVLRSSERVLPLSHSDPGFFDTIMSRHVAFFPSMIPSP